MTTESRTLGIGIVGLGRAGAGVIPAIKNMPNMRLVAGADTNAKPLEVFRERNGAKTYSSIEEICSDPEVDAVWIATPTTLHCPHVILAAEHGKHVIVEKPMAVSLDEAQRMIAACERNGVELVCGGSRSSAPAVRKMREVIRSGELGKVMAMTTWASTDWMLRPRRPDEIDVAQGGGVAFRQAPHQVDTVRLLGGGLVRSVRAVTRQYMPPRNTAPGAFNALLEFEDGTPASLIYNAYGYFMASELFDPNTRGPDAPGADARARDRRAIKTGTRDEAAVKEELNLSVQLGTRRASGEQTDTFASGLLADLGLLVVSCELGDMRQAPDGIYVYDDNGNRTVPIDTNRRGELPELNELYAKLVDGRPILHGGPWGLATLEVCLAIMQSADERREITLQHQVAVPPGW
jgi:phthalate 4,5-cis-dihydrodiol dehydrogenase